MRVEISESAHSDVLDGYWFYNRQEPGLGEYFSDTLYGEMASLRLYAGIHPKRYGFHMMLSRVLSNRFTTASKVVLQRFMR